MLSLCLALNRFSSIFYPFLWEINRNSFEDSNVLASLGLVTRVMTAADFSSNPTLFKYNGICADVTLFVRPKRTPVPVRVTPCRLGEGLNSQCCLLESQCRASTKKNPVPVNRGSETFGAVCLRANATEEGEIAVTVRERVFSCWKPTKHCKNLSFKIEKVIFKKSLWILGGFLTINFKYTA